MSCNDFDITIDNVVRVGQKEEETINVIPTQENQVIYPTQNKTIGKVEVQPIPSDYIIPSGEITITEQGTFNVKEYDKAVVTAPFDSKFAQLINGTLTEVTEEDLQGVTSLRDYSFQKQQNLAKLEMPDTVRTVGNYLCEICTNLVRVKLSNNLSNISNFMFSGCSSLREIVIPEGVTSFGSAAFASCDSLVKMTLPTTLVSIPNNCFAYKSVSKDIYVSNLTNFVKVTGQFSESGASFNLYYNNEKITNLVLPDDSIQTNNILRRFTFVTVDLNKVVTIGDSSFLGCASLTSVRIGENIEQIKASAFASCSKLTEIVIDKPCTTASDVPILANSNAIPSNCIVYVPDSTTQALYQSATNWSTKTIKLKSELQ